MSMSAFRNIPPKKSAMCLPAFKNFVFLGYFVIILYDSVCFGKICPTTDVRNHVRYLEEKLRGCREINGNLKINLIETTQTYSDFDNYEFPELTKISGFLLFFRVKYLPSIGKIFPNLRVIRGVNLFENVALTVYEMPHLQSISLPNLMYIARGGVTIANNPLLCLADAVDWKGIGAQMIRVELTRQNCPTCPDNCQGHCWDSFTCQTVNNGDCHMECLGCTQPNSTRHCIVCKNYEKDGECVDKCPENTYKHEMSFKCLTEEECVNFNTNKTLFVFDNECIEECPPRFQIITDPGGKKKCKFCDSRCQKRCVTEDPIETINDLDKVKGCTHIDSSLVILMRTNSLEDADTDDLNMSLGLIRYIRDFLVIGRNNFIKDLMFLENLTMIEGQDLRQNNNRSIFIYENQNLQKLWDFDKIDFSLTIRKGNIAFHDNPFLCMSEIERLKNATGVTHTAVDVNPYSNGERASNCDREEDDMKIELLQVNRTNVTLTWQRKKTDDVFYYVVFYTEATGDEPVNEQTYSQDVCQSGAWQSIVSTNNTATLVNLLPYQTYNFYIKTYVRQNPNDSMIKILNTKTHSFTTQQDDPDAPRYFQVYAVDYNTINISWDRPRSVNGKLNHYTLSVEMIPDSRSIVNQRDYCRHPRKEKKLTTPLEQDPFQLSHHSKPEPKYKVPDCMKLPEEINIALLIKNHTQYQHFYLCDRYSQSKYGFDECGKYYYESLNQTIRKRSEDRTSSTKKTNLYSLNPLLNQVFRIQPHRTLHTVRHLKHYTMYVFYMEACNSDVDFGNLCSYVLYDFVRTLPKPNADDITQVEVPSVNGRDVQIQWQQPKDPNAEIVAYNIHYYRESEHAQPSVVCLTQNSFLRKKRHVLENLIPGLYYVKLQAVSLAGPGNFTKEYQFEVQSKSLNVFWLGFTVTFFLIMLLVALWVYFRYKRKRAQAQVFVSINPEYSSIYIEDEWEMDRNNIQMIREIGQGTFGMVYYGMIKNKGLPCAIKTVHETASLETRENFLTEASVMKAFSNTHHVIKLLGVVSRGQPPLVIMEIMERGDLKQYLRSLRDSSQNFTCNEIYRMSIEIADGMVFLTAKKFVHRDLAARNCMVGHDRTVKIGDFGMTRDIYETDYYRKGTRGLLPVRWMAPESLADGVFSSDSDVWSYGIVLWEIATLAEQPYQGLSNEQVLQFVVAKGRLERPTECPDLLYEIMHACWYWKPYDRPTFGDIVEKLQDHVGQDFKLVSYYHSKEAREFRMLHGRDRTYNAPALGTGENAQNFYDSHSDNDDDIGLYSGSRRSNFLPFSSLNSLRNNRLTDGFN